MARIRSALSAIYGNDSEWIRTAPAVKHIETDLPEAADDVPVSEENFAPIVDSATDPQVELLDDERHEATNADVENVASQDASPSFAPDIVTTDSSADELAQEQPIEERAVEEQPIEEDSIENDRASVEATNDVESILSNLFSSDETTADTESDLVLELEDDAPTIDEEEEFEEFQLPDMFQPNPAKMEELRAHLGIVTNQDLVDAERGDHEIELADSHPESDLSEELQSDEVPPVDVDESEVLDLVEQVLGIAPNIRDDDVLLQTLEEIERNNSTDETAGDASTLNDSPSEESIPIHATSATATDSEENYRPVMPTWADMPAPNDEADGQHPTDESPADERDESSHSIVADATPPLRGPTQLGDLEGRDPGFDQSASDEKSDLFTDVLAAGDIATEVAIPPGGANDEAPIYFAEEDSEANFQSIPTGEEDPGTTPDLADGSIAQEPPPVAEPMSAADDNGLPDKVPPTEFEIGIASRLLQSNFGARMQQLSDQLKAHVDVNLPQIVLFVGVEENEECSELVAALALYLCGQQERKMLLVDANELALISNSFGKSTDKGLVESVNREVIWQSAISATSCQSLRLLSFGEASADQTIESEDLAGIAEQWKERFGLILVDAGSINGRFVPGLANLADVTYLTVQLGRDERGALAVATQRLSDLNANLKGCITTKPGE